MSQCERCGVVLDTGKMVVHMAAHLNELDSVPESYPEEVTPITNHVNTCFISFSMLPQSGSNTDFPFSIHMSIRSMKFLCATLTTLHYVVKF